MTSPDCISSVSLCASQAPGSRSAPVYRERAQNHAIMLLSFG